MSGREVKVTPLGNPQHAHKAALVLGWRGAPLARTASDGASHAHRQAGDRSPGPAGQAISAHGSVTG